MLPHRLPARFTAERSPSTMSHWMRDTGMITDSKSRETTGIVVDGLARLKSGDLRVRSSEPPKAKARSSSAGAKPPSGRKRGRPPKQDERAKMLESCPFVAEVPPPLRGLVSSNRALLAPFTVPSGLLARGWTVEDDLSSWGFDNVDQWKEGFRPLTSIRSHRDREGCLEFLVTWAGGRQQCWVPSFLVSDSEIARRYRLEHPECLGSTAEGVLAAVERAWLSGTPVLPPAQAGVLAPPMGMVEGPMMESLSLLLVAHPRVGEIADCVLYRSLSDRTTPSAAVEEFREDVLRSAVCTETGKALVAEATRVTRVVGDWFPSDEEAAAEVGGACGSMLIDCKMGELATRVSQVLPQERKWPRTLNSPLSCAPLTIHFTSTPSLERFRCRQRSCDGLWRILGASASLATGC
jgi:hypothetical protein